MANHGMTKLLHSGCLPEGLDVSFNITEDPAALVKAASAAGGHHAFDYASLAPDKDHVGIHLVGLGDVETYGFNRNGDGFPKEANVRKHNTFVTNGHVYEHHKNKDPEKALGKIAASFHNDKMGRVELFIHAHREKAASHLSKMNDTGEVPFSMACHVKNDRCAVCNTLRKTASDPDQCDHVRYSLGKQADNGDYHGVYNDDPNYFDMSFVIRPADRIAWNLKTASEGTMLDSVSFAEQEGIVTPAELQLTNESTIAKYAMAKRLAEYERRYMKIACAGPKTPGDNLLVELAKAASFRTFTDAQISELRVYEPTDVFHKLASSQIVMDPQTYSKYVLGDEYHKVAHALPAIEAEVAGIFNSLEKSGQVFDVVNDTVYQASDATMYALAPTSRIEKLAYATADTNSFDMAAVTARAIVNNRRVSSLWGSIMQKSAQNESLALAKTVAKKYATYKLAAARSMQELCPDFGDRHLMLMAAQNLTSKE